ncbi:MAG TPA: TetR family transcriptional regulator, partial [Rhodothermia bacterium]|nr:TetR family transcriptional regulator [Rhodothermia bacterium]
MVSDQTTEERIFEAARDVFYEQGYDGARMQEIAR